MIAELTAGDSGGFEICRTAKSLPSASSLLATTSAPELAPDAILAGCDAVLLKPFAPNLLYARIGRIMRLRNRSRDLRLQSDGLRARLNSQRAKLQHLIDRRDNTMLDWPTTACPYCQHTGVTSFDYSSLHRSWYACLQCKKVWIAKRQE